MKNKRVLVTGGAGFIGSHLCQHLLDQGFAVICLDNFFTGRRENISHLLDHPQFELIEHDITQPFCVDVDEIYNFACPASPVHYQHNPVETVKVSVLGAIHMLDCAKHTGAKILQASTSEVYGDPQVHPQVESYWGHVNPVGLRSCYDEGKRCAETLFMDYHRQGDVRAKIIRIFNTYGPHMHPHDGRVVSNFIVQALRGEDITLFGSGEQTRSFLFVNDLIRATVEMMESEDSFVGPVNIGNPSEITIRELADKILEMTDSRSKIRFEPLPPDDPSQRQPDISLARSALSWEPQISLEEGLIETIRYFKNHLDL